MQRKPLETAVQGSKSMMTQKAELDLNIQGYKVKIHFYVANLKTWDVILGEPALTELDAIMDIRHNTTSIKPKHQPRIELQMMQRSGDIDRIISAGLWMQPTAETDNDSEDQC